MKNLLNFTCCFCDNKIESNEIDPCDINILTNYDKPKEKQANQTFWCHLECFRKALHSDLRKHLVVNLLSNND